MFIGQEKLLNTINSFTLNNIPRTLLFLGEEGCGKHTIIKYLANRLNLELIDLSEIPTTELTSKLVEFSQYPLPRYYFIDLNKVDLKAQNKFLKFIEEPSQNAYICLISNSEVNIIPTVLNRCRRLYFEPYTTNQLKQLNWAIKDDKYEDLIYSICHTPGQLLSLNLEKIQDTYNLCETIVTKSKFANYSNIIKISTKINCKENYNKIDFWQFFKILTYLSFKNFKETNDDFSFKLYTYLVDLQAKTLNKSIIKENYLLMLLNKLWELSRQWN